MILRCVPVSDAPHPGDARLIRMDGIWGKHKMRHAVECVFGKGCEVMVERRLLWQRRKRLKTRILEVWWVGNGVAEKVWPPDGA